MDVKVRSTVGIVLMGPTSVIKTPAAHPPVPAEVLNAGMFLMDAEVERAAARARHQRSVVEVVFLINVTSHQRSQSRYVAWMDGVGAHTFHKDGNGEEDLD